MKEGNKARSKSTQFTGVIGGTQSRWVNGKQVIERVLIKAAPGSRVWVNTDDVEVIPHGGVVSASPLPSPPPVNQIQRNRNDVHPEAIHDRYPPIGTRDDESSVG